MGYRWWVFLHVLGVFGFLSVHGVSIAVGLRLRRERDAARINSLLDLSGRMVMPLYLSMGVLVAGGIAATFAGHLWSSRWILAAIAALVIVTLAMYFMARPYYQKVRFISRAIAEGSQAVTPEQFDGVLMAKRPLTVAWIGTIGLVFILYLMIMKPALGQKAAPVALPTTGTVLQISSTGSVFDPKTLTAPAGQAFSIAFKNNDAGLPHNVAIYTDSSRSRSLFVGETFPGPKTVIYDVKAIPAGTYFFVCDVHAATMTGTFTAT
jgi:plastocyanin